MRTCCALQLTQKPSRVNLSKEKPSNIEPEDVRLVQSDAHFCFDAKDASLTYHGPSKEFKLTTTCSAEPLGAQTGILKAGIAHNSEFVAIASVQIANLPETVTSFAWRQLSRGDKVYLSLLCNQTTAMQLTSFALEICELH